MSELYKKLGKKLLKKSIKRVLYRLRSRRKGDRLWLKRFYFRSQRMKSSIKTLYRRMLWQDYKQFQLMVTGARLGYKSSTIVGLEREYKAAQGVRRPIKSIVNPYRGVPSTGYVPVSSVNSLIQGREIPELLSERQVQTKRYNRYQKVKFKWLLRKGEQGRCYITQTKNNLFVVLMCDKTGKILLELSGGKLGYKGAAKRTRLVAVELGKRIGHASYTKNYRTLTLYLRGRISMLVRGVVQGLMLEQISIRSLVYVREVAHNGVRLCKTRRM